MPFAVVAAGAIAAGGAITSGIMQSNAAKSAASAQVAQEQKALGFQTGVYNNAQGNFQPYIGAGQNALSSLLGAYGLPGGAPGGPAAAFGQFQQTPSYQFPLQQGNLALQRQLASMGLQGSGAALKDAVGYNQGYASQGYQGFLGGIGGIASGGQQAAGQLGNIGMGIGQQVGQTYGAIGNAQASGIIGSANALAGGIQGATNALAGGGYNPYGISPIGAASAGLGNYFSTIGQSSYAPTPQSQPIAPAQYGPLSPYG